MRACPDCGEPEVRHVRDGHPTVNLDPVSGRCVPCLVKATPIGSKVAPASRDYDWQKAAAADED